jgi:hypothetical protein
MLELNVCGKKLAPYYVDTTKIDGQKAIQLMTVMLKLVDGATELSGEIITHT